VSGHVSTRWLFRLLDYQHWDVRVDGEPIAMVIVNTTDATVGIQQYEGHLLEAIVPEHRNARRWLRWLESHEEVDSAFGPDFSPSPHA
jgi:hypothetical protein